jgi:hypothetical protein
MTMHPVTARAHAGRAAIIALALSLALAGCRLFTTPGHDTLRVELESDVATSVRFISSDNFVVGVDQDGLATFHLFQADTAWVQLPFAAEYDLRETGMVYVRAAEAEDGDAVITLRAFVDGDQSFSHSSTLTGTGLQYYYVGF